LSFLKKILKNSKIFKYFNNNFLNVNNRLLLLDERTSKIEEQIKNQNNNLMERLNILEEKYQKINSDNNILLNILENRTKQFECINTELLLLEKNNREKILIVGFYGAPNTGDELMLQSILEKIDTNKHNVTVMLADNFNYKLINYKNINFIHYPKTNMDINIIVSCFDKIIFGGGAVLDDSCYENENAYKYDASTILIELSIQAILNNKEIYCLGLSSSTKINNRNYIKKLDYIIENSKIFSVRDSNTLKTLKKSNIKNIEKIKLIHDLVFSFQHIEHKSNYYDTDKIIIGLVLIGFSGKEKLKNILSWLNEYARIEHKIIEVKMIPFYDFCKSDTVEYKKVVEELSLDLNIDILQYKQTYLEVMDEFNLCDFIINMRYHSTLLCLKNGIPSLNIIYDIHPHYENKMNYLKEKYEMDECFISYNNLSKERFEEGLKYVIDNLQYIKQKENNISKIIEKEAVEQHREILKNIFND